MTLTTNSRPLPATITFAWQLQPALNLHQFIGWIMLRDPLSLERIGDHSGQDAPNRYSQRTTLGRHRILVAEIARVGADRKLDIPSAVASAKRHLHNGTLRCSARIVGDDGRPKHQRAPINAIDWDSLEFDLLAGGAVDLLAGVEWSDIRFPTETVVKLWPTYETGTGAPTVDAVGPEDIVRAVAKGIYARHVEIVTNGARPLSKEELYGDALKEFPTVTAQQFNEAYQMVYRTAPNRPPKAGWGLRDPYRSRLNQDVAGITKSGK